MRSRFQGPATLAASVVVGLAAAWGCGEDDGKTPNCPAVEDCLTQPGDASNLGAGGSAGSTGSGGSAGSAGSAGSDAAPD